ncbi:sugar phosphate isomerase/epimerase family protein [Sphingobium sp. CAP-1]|uniref:sugar phosphate isomerase/epimerase family protein n=1 Tax=Sphingobium sp. CAP-1 TaxID=2676077 RepID=UPI0012BB3E62|nr:sugar phosphate isomerase/epimerase [Sphingobium sp. CAP-1]QGP80505.1 TIM barrel protein [Sphingobium sp. CAP-1]
MLSTDLGLSSASFLHVPLLDRLAPARDAGFRGLSLTPDDILSLEAQGISAADIGARIRDHGLAIREVDCIGCWLPSHHQAGDDRPMAALLRSLTPERAIEAAARIGAPSVTVVDMMDVTPSLDEAAAAFAWLCDLAARHGLKAHIEFMPFGGIPDLASAWAIVQAANRPNGGLTIDSWHFFRSGSSFDLLATISGDRIHCVQINDAPAQPGADLMAETMSSRLVPGEGSFDLPRFIRTLDATGCTAPVSVEIFSSETASKPMAEVIRHWPGATHAVIQQARNR